MREKHQPRARRQKKKTTIKLKETLNKQNKARFPLVTFDWEGMAEKIISQELAEP